MNSCLLAGLLSCALAADPDNLLKQLDGDFVRWVSRHFCNDPSLEEFDGIVFRQDPRVDHAVIFANSPESHG